MIFDTKSFRRIDVKKTNIGATLGLPFSIWKNRDKKIFLH